MKLRESVAQVKAGTKEAMLLQLLSKKGGVTRKEMGHVAGWVDNSVRGFLNSLGNRRGIKLKITDEARGHVYRISPSQYQVSPAIPKPKPKVVGQLRKTIVVSETLGKNLELYSLKMGESQNDVITTALRDFLISKGMRPDESPKVEVRY
jgi:hypothetical protein